jgi:hypothetical protein
VIAMGTLAEDTEFTVDCNGAMCVANTAVPPRGRSAPDPCFSRREADTGRPETAEAAKAEG